MDLHSNQSFCFNLLFFSYLYLHFKSTVFGKAIKPDIQAELIATFLLSWTFLHLKFYYIFLVEHAPVRIAKLPRILSLIKMALLSIESSYHSPVFFDFKLITLWHFNSSAMTGVYFVIMTLVF